MPVDLTTIVVDGQSIRVDSGSNLLAACLSAGQDIPYFCWHAALGSVGACRQCAVQIFRGPDDHIGQIVMACMTPVVPGLRVAIADPQTATAREKTLEFVLTNHPHDCPVCEVGGECHLQDMTVLTGHAARRTRFSKRTHLNQNLGPFIKHEMNRCIGCYRCVRFYQDYAGGTDFGVFGANKNIYFGRAADGPLTSNFAGNLVEVCPTGVFVDKPFSQNFRRKWDMQATPSICPHCATGCNITISARDGEFRRVTNRFNPSLNGYFICDRGRFGPGFLNSPQRLRMSRNHAGPLTPAAARAELTAFLQQENLIGIGSPRASFESNFLLRRIVGPQNFYSGTPDHAAAMAQAAITIMRATPCATLQQIEMADAVLVLGDDPCRTAPRLALALRQAATRPQPAMLAARGIPAWHAAAARDAAAGTTNPFFIVTPSGTELDSLATQAIRLSHRDIASLAASTTRNATPQAQDIAQALQAAASPVIIAGGSAAICTAAAYMVLHLRRHGVAARLCLLLPEANSLGLALLQPRPLSTAPSTAAIALETSHQPNAQNLCVLDHIETAATQTARLAIAVGSFADTAGTFVNLEGRAQIFHKAIAGGADPAWLLLRDAAIAAGRLPEGVYPTHAALLADITEEFPEFAGIGAALATPATLPYRQSGRNAAHAHHQAPAADLRQPPGWNSNQAINKAPAATQDIFLFNPPGDAPDFPIPPSTEPPPHAPEDLSALSPAIIARAGTP